MERKSGADNFLRMEVPNIEFSAPADLGNKPQNKNANIISLLIVLSPCFGPWF